MNTRIVQCKVSDEYVTGAGVVLGAEGSHDDVLLELAFSDFWQGLTKSITWWNALGEPARTILTVDMVDVDSPNIYRVPVPAEAKAAAGNMEVTIKGSHIVDGIEERATVSVTAQFRVLSGKWAMDADEPQDVTPSQAEQIQAGIDALMDELVEGIKASKEAAASRDAAAASEAAAKESETKAAASARDAAVSETNAKESETKAAASAQDAAVSETNAKESEAAARDAALAAVGYRDEALDYANNAAEWGMSASGSAAAAAASEVRAEESAEEAQESYAATVAIFREASAAESERRNAEDLRKRAEESRVTAENDRTIAEIERTNAETARAEAEKNREEEHKKRKVVQEPGNSTTAVMSQDAVTKAIPKIITPEMYGASGNGEADDSGAIQAALDAAGSVSVVYLGAKKYKIATGLTLTGSYKTLICDGWLVYSGAGAAITVKNAYRCKMQINTIDAANGTALKLDATEGAVYSNDFAVDVIRNSKIGIHLYTDGSHISHNTLRNTYMTAKETAIKVWADSYYINENLWYLDWVGGTWTTGIHLYSASSLSNLAGLGVNDNKFYSGSLEGTNAESIPLLIEQSWGNYFKELRCAEGYGAISVKIVGKCVRNDISLNHLTLSEVDISELGAGSVHNVLRCRGTNSDTTNFFIVGDEVRLSAVHGFTYWPDRYDYNVNAETFAGNVITRVGTAIPTAITFQSEASNGETFVVGAIYSESGSMARGFPLTVLFGDGVGRVMLNDSKGGKILDNRSGDFDGKTVSVRWAGFHGGLNKNIWDVQEIDGGIGVVDVTNLAQDVGFVSDDYGVVLGSESGNKFRIVAKDNGLLTTVAAGDVNQVPLSTDTDGSVFNGTGYQNESRISSGGEVKSATNGTATGFIPVQAGDIIRFSGGRWETAIATNCVNYLAGDKKTVVGYFAGHGDYGGIFTAPDAVTVLSDGMYQVTVPDDDRIAYLRLSMYGPNGAPGENLVVYVDGEKEQTPIVESVNGKTGAVVLSASDVGALPSNTKIPSKTSDLTNDSGFINGYTETDPTVPSWAKATSKPSYTKSEVGLGNVDNVKQYSASNPPPYPVSSVNGKTGTVSLSAADVGARPSDWTPTAANVGAVPTTRKVNNKALSADVTLSASDVGAMPAANYTTKVLTVTYEDGTSESVTLVVSK